MSEKTLTLEQAIEDIKGNLEDAQLLVDREEDRKMKSVYLGQMIALKDCLTILSKIKQ